MKTLCLPIRLETHEQDRKRICEQIQSCPANVTVTISKGVARSAEQNAFYWGVIIPLICEFQGEYETDRDRVHENLCCQFLKVSDGVNENGVSFTVVKPTSNLTTVEFEKYLFDIREYFASEFGLILPLPNEAEPPETKLKIIEARKARLTEIERLEARNRQLEFELNQLKQNGNTD